jgi:hypothetical protein
MFLNNDFIKRLFYQNVNLKHLDGTLYCGPLQIFGSYELMLLNNNVDEYVDIVKAKIIELVKVFFYIYTNAAQ